MIKLSDQDSYRLISRVKEISGIIIEPPIEVCTDTSRFERIYRGKVIQLEGMKFVVSGDVYEFRFGLEGMPKFWVKQGYDLSSGQRVVIKFEFHEEIRSKIGPHAIPCFRDPEKEAEVLSLVRGDPRFMQGRSFYDDCGNNVRVLGFVDGINIYQEIMGTKIDHEQYYYTRMPSILKKFVSCCEAIQMLHDNFFCHGDIRSDHILVNEENGEFCWIDFDLYQNFESFDLWRLGRVLHFIIGMGMNTIQDIRHCGRFTKEVISSIQPTDKSWYYPDRLMNLRKIYPYVSRDLNDILTHFSAGAELRYSVVSELIQDLKKLCL